MTVAEYRQNTYTKLTELLFPDKIKKLEQSLHTYAVHYVHDNNLPQSHVHIVYLSKLNNIIKNLEPRTDNLSTLLVDIVNDNVDVKVIPYLTAAEMNTALWKPIMDMRQIKEDIENDNPTTDAYDCRFCGPKTCFLKGCFQMRSADEPMTKIFECKVCSRCFRVYQ